MDTRQVASDYRLSQWTQAMKAHKASGVSITSYCESRGISRNTYFYWQRKVRAAACQELASRNQSESALTEKPPVPNGWAMAAPAHELAKDQDSAIIVEIGPFRVRVTADTDLELLAKICRTLMPLC